METLAVSKSNSDSPAIKDPFLATPSVFDYDHPTEFLKDTFKYKKNLNPRISIKSWSKKMGFKNSSSLEHILGCRREILVDHLFKISQGVKLSKNEMEYLDILVRLRGELNSNEQNILSFKKERIKTFSQGTKLKANKFTIISNWYHFAICAMSHLKGFQSNSKWISNRLNTSLSTNKIDRAIVHLLETGLMEIKNGSLVTTEDSVNYHSTRIDRDLGKKAVRSNHRQVLKLADEALSDLNCTSISTTSTMTINSSKLPEAQKLIMEFRANLAALTESNDGDSTYQLGLYFFPITKENTL